MKINWFSPLPPAQTEIANHTMRLLAALKDKFDVTFWSEQVVRDPKVEKLAKVQHFSEGNIDWRLINEADINIYNIGNNIEFHQLIWKISQKQPGIVVLHDTHLQHLFCGCFGQLQDKKSHIEAMRHYYGAEGGDVAETYWIGELPIETLAVRFPLTQLAIENALAVLVHTHGAVASIKKFSTIPVCYAPLPMAAGEPPQISGKGHLPRKLVSFGFIGPNRRIESILEAMASLEKPECFHLDICGRIWDEKSVLSRAKALGVRPYITYHGFVKDEVLDKILNNADLAINLRYPTMGEASASQLRIWKHAVPSVVTKVGWYAELPESVVEFIRPESEVADLRGVLSRLLNNKNYLKERGYAGRALLASEYSPAKYVASLEQLLRTLPQLRSRWQALDLATTVGKTMSPFPEGIDTPLMSFVAKHIKNLVA